ncbi:MAG TPA: ATP-binding protein [Acidimicrobiales bacterium]|nr:ATP-binding protein [Acidimicrobiales bacterium]
MNIKLSLSMPRDESTLPLVRHLCKYSLWEIGVAHECVSDIELALTEACANVVEHSTRDDEYEVHIEVNQLRCEIRVIDAGHGFDFESLGQADADHSAEGGRGIQLMRALVDRVRFISEPEEGTIVHLVKDLAFAGAAGPPFARRPAPPRHEPWPA